MHDSRHHRVLAHDQRYVARLNWHRSPANAFKDVPCHVQPCPRHAHATAEYGWRPIPPWPQVVKTIYSDLKFNLAQEGVIVLPHGPLTYPVLKNVQRGPYQDAIL